MRENARYENISRNQHFEEYESKPYYATGAYTSMKSNHIQYPVEEVGQIVFIKHRQYIKTPIKLKPRQGATDHLINYISLNPYQLPTQGVVPRVWDLRQSK